MASKFLQRQLGTLTTLIHYRTGIPNYRSVFKFESLIQSRRYSGYPPPHPTELKPPPPPTELKPPPPHISSNDSVVHKFYSSLNQDELAKFSAIADTW